jgi:hypothetical protein
MIDRLSVSQQYRLVGSSHALSDEVPFPLTFSILHSVSHEDHVSISAAMFLRLHLRRGPYYLYALKNEADMSERQLYLAKTVRRTCWTGFQCILSIYKKGKKETMSNYIKTYSVLSESPDPTGNQISLVHALPNMPPNLYPFQAVQESIASWLPCSPP